MVSTSVQEIAATMVHVLMDSAIAFLVIMDLIVVTSLVLAQFVTTMLIILNTAPIVVMMDISTPMKTSTMSLMLGRSLVNEKETSHQVYLQAHRMEFVMGLVLVNVLLLSWETIVASEIANMTVVSMVTVALSSRMQGASVTVVTLVRAMLTKKIFLFHTQTLTVVKLVFNLLYQMIL